MTGSQIQMRLDNLVADLQTYGKGQAVNVLFRNNFNQPQIFNLSASAAGVINASELSAISDFIASMITTGDAYEAAFADLTRENVTENYGELLAAKGRYVTAPIRGTEPAETV